MVIDRGRLDIGAMRKRLELQSKVKTPNSQGGRTVTYTTFATVWGAGRPLNGRELLQAQQVKSMLTYAWRIRYRGDVTAQIRLKVGTRLWQVENVLNTDERNRELVLLCAEVQ